MVPGEVNLIVLQFYLFFTCWEIRTRLGRGGRAMEVLITGGRDGGRRVRLASMGRGTSTGNVVLENIIFI